MDLLYTIMTSSSYSQLSWVVHFLQNLLTHSIAISMSLPVGMAKVVIDILLVALCYCLPVRNERDIEEHVKAKCKGPWLAVYGRGHCNSHRMHCSGLSLVHNVSSLCQILQRFAV